MAILATMTVLMLPAHSATAQGPSEPLVQRIESLEAGQPVQVLGEPLLAREVLRRFYENHGFQEAWSFPGNRRELVEAIRQIANDGLNPEDYHGPLLSELALRARDDLSGEMQADIDLLFSDAFLLAASHLLEGKVNPQTIHAEWSASRQSLDLAVTLAEALRDNTIAATLDSLRPTHRAYAKLMEARNRLTPLLGHPWLPIADGPSIHPGDQDSRLPEIRRRLAALGDITAPGDPETAVADPTLYSQDLDLVIPSFQARHGLEPDGIIGKKTLAAVNLMPVERIRQIDASLERWRWLPQFLGEDYVIVNIAGFGLQLVMDGREALQSRVIVGRPYRQTPVFSDRIRYLVFNPTWTVPRKLMIEDLLPQIMRDPGYLERQGIRVYQGWGSDRQEINPAVIDWPSLSRDNFPYQLVQDPGPLNALGQVKFMFPNPYAVYLHDTPGQYLFGRQERTFSSGCIRVEKPMDLAEQLLAGAPEWSRERIDRLLEEKIPVTAVLPDPIPIYIQYWTAWVDEDQRIQFRDDIYNRDFRLLAQLRQSATGGNQLPTPVVARGFSASGGSDQPKSD
ncbi:Murein L,D-transpeptidase YcbB/YkuD [Marinobacter pelagius]|uniref:Murein L,D-transpeptidase YcbB/YkuD n=1 Tax=Marinobacter pelagius TaxID=379482 RepID=A0A1I4UYY2_9GAMM|nr:Murein L,D-transpeptidase YcbB/YkuD [Marinobacter pelagius]